MKIIHQGGPRRRINPDAPVHVVSSRDEVRRIIKQTQHSADTVRKRNNTARRQPSLPTFKFTELQED